MNGRKREQGGCVRAKGGKGRCWAKGGLHSWLRTAALLPPCTPLSRQVNPDTEARVLERWAAHNRELKRARKHG